MTDPTLSLALLVTLPMLLLLVLRLALRIVRELSWIHDATCRVLAECHETRRMVAESVPINPHAHLLGRVVEARKYEISDWERYIVCAVGWHGSVCLRDVDDPDRKGFWVHGAVAMPDRFREVDE